MAESVEWVWQHYIFVEKCRECDCNFLNNRYSSSSSEETLTKLKEHSFNKHNITKHNSEHNVEYDEDNKKMVPVRGFIRKHFLKLKEGVAECIHCFDKINYNRTAYYYRLHSHLKRKHKDKLTEIQKKERLIAWYWDHFTVKDEWAICNSCNVKYSTREVAQIIKHLKSYKKPGPSSSSHTNITNSNTDMGTHAKETNKCQENAHSPPMVITREADDESVLQHYIPTLIICKKCDYSYSLNNEASLSLSKDILTKLEKHLLDKHNINYDFVQDDINKKKIPVRRYIRKHFSKLKKDMAKCNICFEVINYQLKAYMLRKHVKYNNLRSNEHLKYNLLLEHLKYSHKDKLTEIQKKEKKLSWHWDYFTPIKNNEQYAICTTCKRKKKHVYSLKAHLIKAHKMTGPGSDTDDTDMDQPTIEAKRQENTNSPQNKTAIMAEQETKDNKKTGPSSRNDTDNTDNDTDMSQPTKEAKHQRDSKTLSKNMYKVTSAISAGTSEETSDSTFYRTPPTTFLTDHLKPHKKTGPSSSSHPDNTDNDTDMGQPTKEAERQENTNSPQNRTAIMAEQKTEDNKWVLQYYNPTLTCHKCNVRFSSDKDRILSSKETLTKLKDHLLHKHKLNYDSMIEHNIQHNVNKQQIPVRNFIRKHYTKLRGDTVKCNYCFKVISYTYMNYSSLHVHLKCEHDKLTEVEKNDINFPWYWDYFTPIDTSDEAISAKCNICNSPCYTFPTTSLTEHLKTHKPSSSSSYGYNMDFSAQHQSRELFGAPIPLSKQIRELDTVNENVPSTSESTVSFDQSDFDSLCLQTLFSLQEELYQTWLKQADRQKGAIDKISTLKSMDSNVADFDRNLSTSKRPDSR